MLSIPASVRVFIHREPVDFRKSHDGLSGIIRRELKEDPLSGDLFAFLNKRRDRVKLLQFDGNGLWLHYKRLENGTFRQPTLKRNGAAQYTRADLALLLEGIEVKKGKLMERVRSAHASELLTLQRYQLSSLRQRLEPPPSPMA